MGMKNLGPGYKKARPQMLKHPLLQAGPIKGLFYKFFILISPFPRTQVVIMACPPCREAGPGSVLSTKERGTKIKINIYNPIKEGKITLACNLFILNLCPSIERYDVDDDVFQRVP
jgi:hypothetical protein